MPATRERRIGTGQRAGATVLAAVVAPAGAALVQASPAAASVPYPPITSVGIYVHDIAGNATYDLGCFFGYQQAQNSGSQTFLAILDFGRPTLEGGSQGASLFRGSTKNTSQIAESVKDFSRGWWDCNNTTANDNLWIAMGTSNYGANVTPEHGAAWGNAVELVRNYINTSGWNADISARGAIDAEMSWGPPDASWEWWLGFNSTSTSAVYDFGDASGCSWTGVTSACDNGWTREDIWHVAQDAATPQIYSTTGHNAGQWYWMSRWALTNVNEPVFFRGALSQEAACGQSPPCPGADNTPHQSYAQLYNALSQNSATAQQPSFMVNFMWQ